MLFFFILFFSPFFLTIQWIQWIIMIENRKCENSQKMEKEENLPWKNRNSIEKWNNISKWIYTWVNTFIQIVYFDTNNYTAYKNGKLNCIQLNELAYCSRQKIHKSFQLFHFSFILQPRMKSWKLELSRKSVQSSKKWKIFVLFDDKIWVSKVIQRNTIRTRKWFRVQSSYKKSLSKCLPNKNLENIALQVDRKWWTSKSN